MTWHQLLRDTAIAGAIIGFLVLFLAVRFARSSVAKFGFEMLLWRFVSGHHHHGNHKTDATWFHWGTKAYGHDERATKWEYMPRALRAAYRLGISFAVFIAIVGVISVPGVTLHALLALGVFGLLSGVFISYNKITRWHHSRNVLNPLAAALAQSLKASKTVVRRMIHITPEDLTAETGDVGYIDLPPGFEGTEAQCRVIERIVDTHLPVDAEIDWQFEGARKRARVFIAGQPPQEYLWEQAKADMARCAEGQVLLGTDRHKRPFYATFATGEDPHWGFYCAPGRGKTTQLANIAVQMLRQNPGNRVVYLDPKAVSAQWLEVIPGLTYVHDPDNIHQMWSAIVKFREMMDERRHALEANPDLDFPRAVLMIDELNRFTDITRTIWARDRQPGEPRVAPVFNELAAILWLGRQFRCHVVLVGQRLDDRSVGISGLRDALGFRGLSGYRPNAWRIFIGTSPVPRSQGGVGRWIYVKDEQETWVQNVYGTEQEMIDWGLNGRSPQNRRSATASQPVTDLPFDKQPDAVTETRIIGNKNAAQYLGLNSVSTFRNARYAYPIPGETRVAGQPAWEPEDLAAWNKSRPKVDKSKPDEVDSSSDGKEDPDTNTEGTP
jgi:hypothetical protein